MATLVGMAYGASDTADQGELLYNGIRLPAEWPPDRDPKDRIEMSRIPYLEQANIPEVIPIDVGRQLFVDDFLIEKTDLQRTYHPAEKYSGNPVLTSSDDWRQSAAGTLQGGVFYDPFEERFKIFYMDNTGARYAGHKKVAVSKDGIDWSFPHLGLYSGLYSTETGELIEPRAQSDNTFLLQPSGPGRAGDQDSIWLDAETKDPSQRYKFLVYYRGRKFTDGKEHPGETGYYLCTISEDYKISSEQIMANRRPGGDYSSIAYNPFRKKWIHSIRDGGLARYRSYLEHEDYMKSYEWSNSVFWAESDEQDEAQLTIPEFDFKPQLYSLNVVAYESIMLGGFQIQRCGNKQARERKMWKITDIHMGYSRDGFHFYRPPKRDAFIQATRKEGTWDRGYLHIPPGICTVVGDKLYFYYTGCFSGINGEKGETYSGCAIGLATLRRDGFASMDAGQAEGSLTTRPVRFKGNYMFVNVDCPKGELRAELLDENDQPIAPFTLANCQPVKTDSTLYQMAWKGADELAALAGKPVKIRFTLTNGELYAFWVSPDKSGASYGYVGAGGPGFTGNKDTVGRQKD
jgi:hypothetical protein